MSDHTIFQAMAAMSKQADSIRPASDEEWAALVRLHKDLGLALDRACERVEAGLLKATIEADLEFSRRIDEMEAKAARSVSDE